MLQDLDHPERRTRARQRIASACELYLCATGETCAGILRSLDFGGARVKISSRSIVLSGRVQLRSRTQDHGTFRVVWQNGQEIGLQALIV
ncbi:hypothetical protein [Brevundimonas variabilis]|uniref:PilZ domain-containing protein n=1 Tax=Brevundimonas variabilis TaxID=74312 RepID=A0A7W9CL20_9CAUL|nr:hypothetical protein [Brevundimonas variabilis]MBB5747393.1 hypothetical protein [Brevundimonas variabilis]